MLRNVFLKTLLDQRRSMLWWVVGLVLLTFITILFYPSLSEMPEINDLLGEADSVIRAFVGDIDDLTSPEGFLNSQLYFMLVPLLFVVFAIVIGVGAIAGEERRGTLDLLLSTPLARWRLLLEKFGSMVVATLALALVLWLTVVIGAAAVGMKLSLSGTAEVTLSAGLLGIALGTVALTVGSATGKTGLSIGVAGVIAVVSYFLNALAPVVEGLDPARKVSLFYYYIGADPLTNGINLAHAAVLVGTTLVLLAVALATFERRDLAV